MPIATVDAPSREKDFYTQLTNEIAAGNVDGAVEMIMGLPGQDSQLATLRRLVNALYEVLERDLKYTRKIGRISDLARILALARNLARDLARVLDLYRDSNHAHSLATALALTFALELTIVHAIALSKTGDLSHIMTETGKTTRTISRCLELMLDVAAVTEEENKRHQISLRGIDTLTPHALMHTVSPYLQALFDLQHIIADLKQDVYAAPRILSISQNSPFSVELTKVPDAINALVSIITPGGRKVAKQLEELKIKNAQAEIALKEVQIAEAQARSTQALEQAQVEIELKKAEAEKLRAESAKEYFEIDKAKIEMALAIIDKQAPNLPETERLTYLTRLLQPLGVIIESPLKPTTLPK